MADLRHLLAIALVVLALAGCGSRADNTPPTSLAPVGNEVDGTTPEQNPDRIACEEKFDRDVEAGLVQPHEREYITRCVARRELNSRD